ncbi:YibE/F family protein [Clostridium kluyveri]|uniref:YibE/F family protein n=1 Tax=Clostridium kluyveri TaxID=1534 RepID=UPI0022473A7A|nr:YibE/F family protein [Clostridium kluyveri]UZQ49469.1 YibE/F family protein [Clostridium kluyveri]
MLKLFTKESKKYFFSLVILFLFIVQSIIPLKVFADDNSQTINTDSIRAKIVQIVSDKKKNITAGDKNVVLEEQTLKIQISSGKHKGEDVTIKNTVDPSKQGNLIFNEGDQVFLSISEDSNGNITSSNIYQVARDKPLTYLLIFFILSMILIGRGKGFKSIITLTFTCFMVIKVFLNLILQGYNPITISIFVCIAIAIVSLIVIGGINRKTISAIIGTTSGVVISGVISFIVVNLTKVSGVGTEEAQLLMDIPLKHALDFKAILFAAILIGALGAVMDVSMSIASTMTEIKEAHPKISPGRLMKAGMVVGRDTMGTMATTLILAYISGSICLVLGYLANNSNFLDIVNQDMIACEIIKTLAGSIGLIFTIPITVIVCCILSD